MLALGLCDGEPMVVVQKDRVTAIVVGAGGHTTKEWVAIASEGGKINVASCRVRGEYGGKLGHRVTERQANKSDDVCGEGGV